ncbi:MAG TPA: metallophosphoesterase [Frankiaceae bacterium]|jgi:acid phosphatase|nr:metallophosphoesterase [Frankiaceae bacterium]
MPRFRRDLASLGLALLLACSPERAAAPPAAAPPARSPSPSSAPATSVPPSPSRAASPPTVVAAFGDWGIEGGRADDVVRLVNGWRPLDAVLTTGDNAYGTGTRTEAARARRFVEPLLRRRVPFYASLGNHDVVTANGAHVMRSLGIPAHWYTRVVGRIEVVVLDSNRPGDREQAAFLRRVLAAPRRAAFRVVVFHHPPTSCSLHGANRDVERAWVALLHGRVDAVLAGHNHTYERFDVGGVPYVTTGGGGARLYPSIPGLCNGPGRPVTVKTVYHAMRLTATDDRLTLEAVGLDGKTFDRYDVAAG